MAWRDSVGVESSRLGLKSECAMACHCPADMAVRMREVLARPWVSPAKNVCACSTKNDK